MGVEYEAKFLDIDEEATRQKLKELGAQLKHPKRKYVRAVYHRCTDEVSGFGRVRDEGGDVTMTVKLFKDPKFPEEYEVTIKEDFETGRKFMKALGIVEKGYQETYREKWTHPLAHEITIDYVPGIPTYMEIDCESEENLNKLVEMFGLSKDKMRFGSFDRTYEEYYGVPRDVINKKTPSLTFKNILNEITPTKNEDLLRQMAEKHKDMGVNGGISKSSKTWKAKYWKYKRKYEELEARTKM